MSVSEEQLNQWAKAPSETESERCENAITQITQALRDHFSNSITFIRQGSQRNRTNIRIDSDVDIAVVHNGYHFPGIASLSAADKALYEATRAPASYPFAQFKSDVHSVLTKNFGVGFVERKNKCVFVKGNTYRVNADVVPAYEYLRYRSYGVVEATGIAFATDGGEIVYGFPEQHYANGVKKNDETGRSYKAVVRMLKNLRGELVDTGVISDKLIASFFIESLVWNVPISYFAGKTWRDDIVSVSAKVWNEMRIATTANDYAEVSDLQWLFRGQKRTPAQAEEFMLHAWQHVKP